jgi:hypothetical protein
MAEPPGLGPASTAASHVPSAARKTRISVLGHGLNEKLEPP